MTLIGSERDVVAVFKSGQSVSLRQMTERCEQEAKEEA